MQACSEMISPVLSSPKHILAVDLMHRAGRNSHLLLVLVFSIYLSFHFAFVLSLDLFKLFGFSLFTSSVALFNASSEKAAPYTTLISTIVNAVNSHSV